MDVQSLLRLRSAKRLDARGSPAVSAEVVSSGFEGQFSSQAIEVLLITLVSPSPGFAVTIVPPDIVRDRINLRTRSARARFDQYFPDPSYTESSRNNSLYGLAGPQNPAASERTSVTLPHLLIVPRLIILPFLEADACKIATATITNTSCSCLIYEPGCVQGRNATAFQKALDRIFGSMFAIKGGDFSFRRFHRIKLRPSQQKMKRADTQIWILEFARSVIKSNMESVIAGCEHIEDAHVPVDSASLKRNPTDSVLQCGIEKDMKTKAPLGLLEPLFFGTRANASVAAMKRLHAQYSRTLMPCKQNIIDDSKMLLGFISNQTQTEIEDTNVQDKSPESCDWSDGQSSASYLPTDTEFELDKDEPDGESVSLFDSSLIFSPQTEDIRSELDKTSDRSSNASSSCWSQGDEEDSELDGATEILSDSCSLYWPTDSENSELERTSDSSSDLYSECLSRVSQGVNNQSNCNKSGSAASSIHIDFLPSKSCTEVAEGNIEVAGPLGDTTPSCEQPQENSHVGEDDHEDRVIRLLGTVKYESLRITTENVRDILALSGPFPDAKLSPEISICIHRYKDRMREIIRREMSNALSMCSTAAAEASSLDPYKWQWMLANSSSEGQALLLELQSDPRITSYKIQFLLGRKHWKSDMFRKIVAVDLKNLREAEQIWGIYNIDAVISVPSAGKRYFRYVGSSVASPGAGALGGVVQRIAKGHETSIGFGLEEIQRLRRTEIPRTTPRPLYIHEFCAHPDADYVYQIISRFPIIREPEPLQVLCKDAIQFYESVMVVYQNSLASDSKKEQRKILQTIRPPDMPMALWSGANRQMPSSQRFHFYHLAYDHAVVEETKLILEAHLAQTRRSQIKDCDMLSIQNQLAAQFDGVKFQVTPWFIRGIWRHLLRDTQLHYETRAEERMRLSMPVLVAIKQHFESNNLLAALVSVNQNSYKAFRPSLLSRLAIASASVAQPSEKGLYTPSYCQKTWKWIRRHWLHWIFHKKNWDAISIDNTHRYVQLSGKRRHHTIIQRPPQFVRQRAELVMRYKLYGLLKDAGHQLQIADDGKIHPRHLSTEEKDTLINSATSQLESEYLQERESLAEVIRSRVGCLDQYLRSLYMSDIKTSISITEWSLLAKPLPWVSPKHSGGRQPASLSPCGLPNSSVPVGDADESDVVGQETWDLLDTAEPSALDTTRRDFHNTHTKPPTNFGTDDSIGPAFAATVLVLEDPEWQNNSYLGHQSNKRKATLPPTGDIESRNKRLGSSISNVHRRKKRKGALTPSADPSETPVVSIIEPTERAVKLPFTSVAVSEKSRRSPRHGPSKKFIKCTMCIEKGVQGENCDRRSPCKHSYSSPQDPNIVRCSLCFTQQKRCDGKIPCSSCLSVGIKFSCRPQGVPASHLQDPSIAKCSPCSKAKARCDGNVPCSKCIKSTSRCVPQGTPAAEYTRQDPNVSKCKRCINSRITCDGKLPCSNCIKASRNCWQQERVSRAPHQNLGIEKCSHCSSQGKECNGEVSCSSRVKD